MPGKIALVFAWTSSHDWEVHIHGLGLEAAACIGSFFLERYFDFRTEGNATLSVQSSTITIAPNGNMEYQPDVSTNLHVLRVLRQPPGQLSGAQCDQWSLAWQMVCSAGWLT